MKSFLSHACFTAAAMLAALSVLDTGAQEGFADIIIVTPGPALLECSAGQRSCKAHECTTVPPDCPSYLDCNCS